LAGDGGGDEGGAFLVHQPHQPLLLLDQLVDAGGFTVEEIGNRLLGFEVGRGNPVIRKVREFD
jgi:hypothetical protein